jgi:hypothetical protein
MDSGSIHCPAVTAIILHFMRKGAYIAHTPIGSEKMHQVSLSMAACLFLKENLE